MYDLEAIRERVSLRDLAEEAGAVFKGSGASPSSRCPLHAGSDNPTAFHLYDNGRRWHCFTKCADGENDGDLYLFVQRWKQVDFKTAVAFCAERAGVALTPGPSPDSGRGGKEKKAPPPEPVPSGPNELWRQRAEEFVSYAQKELAGDGAREARQYLMAERGLFEAEWDAFRLGWNGRDWFDAPGKWGLEGGNKIWLPRGVVIPGVRRRSIWYVKVRRPCSEGDGLAQYVGFQGGQIPAKFGGPREGVATLFGADLFLGLPVLLLVEGEFDAMITWRFGRDLVDVGSLGSSNTKPDALDKLLLMGYAAIVQVSDDDEAGEKAREFWQGQARVTTIKPPDHDLTDYWRKGGDLRGWVARLAAQELERLLVGLVSPAFREKRREWEMQLAFCRGEVGSTTTTRRAVPGQVGWMLGSSSGPIPQPLP